MIKWNGYILIEKSTGISNKIKDGITSKATGIDQSCLINYTDSENGEKSLIRCAFDINGDELITYMDSLSIDSYEIFVDTAYDKSQLKIKMNDSSTLAFAYKVKYIDEFGGVFV